jgi:hypothetical protein
MTDDSDHNGSTFPLEKKEKELAPDDDVWIPSEQIRSDPSHPPNPFLELLKL